MSPVDPGLPAPNLIGAPMRYDRWRPFQDRAVLAALDSRKRFNLVAAPVAFGKSLVATVHGVLTPGRTWILTSTKNLQAQYEEENREIGMVQVKGLNSYPCVEGQANGKFGDMRREGPRADRGLPMMCDEAPCQSGAFCHRRDGGCEYYDAYRKATSLGTKLVVTNYAYWMSINKFGEGPGPVDVLIMDEAHNAMEELGGFVGTELRFGEVESVMPGARMLDQGADQMQWRSWAGYWQQQMEVALEQIKQAIRASEQDGANRTGEKLNYSSLARAAKLRRLIHKVSTIAHMAGDWIIDWTEDSGRRPIIKFDPVWPGEYAESTLFCGVKKVLMISATIRPESAYRLNCNPADVEFHEYPSPIPKERRPIIYSPVAQMNRNVKAEGKRDWSRHMDLIIARRLDRKGIIHSVSYQRAREIWMGSEYKQIMLMHDSTNTREVIEQFKRMPPPAVLVSPVLDTGYDFKYEMAEYQIISKMPFPVTVDKVIKARAAHDKSYKDLLTAITLMQMVGRVCRYEDDLGETFIIDGDFGWWYKYAHKYMAVWFKEALRFEQFLGLPLPKLVRVA